MPLMSEANLPDKPVALPEPAQPALPEVKKLPLPDNTLVERAQQGDMRAFEELVRRYEHKVYSITYRMMGREDDAREAMQEAFLRAYRFLRKFEFKSSFYTWLYRIATNVSLTKLRARKQPPMVSLDEPVGEEGGAVREIPDEKHSPVTDYRRKELRDAIQQAVDGLPSDYRPVIVLRDLEGLSNSEVGEALKLSVPAVKSRLHRGRMLLRERLARYMKKDEET
jgi:RNA polymerase sigma-70 factor (ECF subfamily)